jgi:hypothetical protein
MKRLMVLMIFGMLLCSATGCRIGECWRYAWNSRFPPRQTVVVAEPCVVTESCGNPCASPCSSPCGGATLMAPGPAAP